MQKKDGRKAKGGPAHHGAECGDGLAHPQPYEILVTPEAVELGSQIEFLNKKGLTYCAIPL